MLCQPSRKLKSLVFVSFMIIAGLAFLDFQYGEAILETKVHGNWYMGTHSGKDCFLTFAGDRSLTVTYGGCFSKEPPIASKWHLEGGHIVLQNQSLRTRLGDYLVIKTVDRQLALVPQKHLDITLLNGISQEVAFERDRN